MAGKAELASSHAESGAARDAAGLAVGHYLGSHPAECA